MVPAERACPIPVKEQDNDEADDGSREQRMRQPAMPQKVSVLHAEPEHDDIEVWRDREERSEKPQVPRHARAMGESRKEAGGDDVRWGRSHQTFLT
jgi:hypothetical protein